MAKIDWAITLVFVVMPMARSIWARTEIR